MSFFVCVDFSAHQTPDTQWLNGYQWMLCFFATDEDKKNWKSRTFEDDTNQACVLIKNIHLSARHHSKLHFNPRNESNLWFYLRVISSSFHIQNALVCAVSRTIIVEIISHAILNAGWQTRRVREKLINLRSEKVCDRKQLSQSAWIYVDWL